jgi:hypothetical protein
MCTVAAGASGGRRLSLADYVRGTGATRGRPPPESANVGSYEAAGRVKWSVVLLLVLGSHILAAES